MLIVPILMVVVGVVNRIWVNTVGRYLNNLMVTLSIAQIPFFLLDQCHVTFNVSADTLCPVSIPHEGTKAENIQRGVFLLMPVGVDRVPKLE